MDPFAELLKSIKDVSRKLDKLDDACECLSRLELRVSDLQAAVEDLKIKVPKLKRVANAE